MLRQAYVVVNVITPANSWELVPLRISQAVSTDERCRWTQQQSCTRSGILLKLDGDNAALLP